MKYLAILMVFVLLLSGAAAAYVYLTANVTVTGTGIAAVEATGQQESFEALKLQMKDNAVVGTVFTPSLSGAAEDYKFVTYRVQLKNSTYLDAEMVQLQVIPRDGDVLQMGSPVPLTLAAQGSGVYETTILTAINAYVGREVNVTYYLWGQPFTVRAVCNE